MDVHQELITLRFISELFFIDLTQDVVQRILNKFSVIDDEVYWISLAVREAVINAIKHGNQFNPEKYVQLLVRIDDSMLHVEVTDEGNGFECRRGAEPPERREHPEAIGTRDFLYPILHGQRLLPAGEVRRDVGHHGKEVILPEAGGKQLT